MKLHKCLQHLTDVFHDVGLQRFVRCASSEPGHSFVKTQEAQVRALNVEGGHTNIGSD